MAEPLNLEALKAWAKWAPNPTYPEDAKGRLISACGTIQDLIAEIERLQIELSAKRVGFKGDSPEEGWLGKR